MCYFFCIILGTLGHHASASVFKGVPAAGAHEPRRQTGA